MLTGVPHIMRRLSLAALLLAGCAHEVARIRWFDEGPADATVVVENIEDPIGLGVRIDADYSGPFEPVFDVDLRDAHGASVAHSTCDVRRDHTSRVCSMSVRSASHSSEHCGYGTSCELYAPAPGVYTVHAQLAYGAHQQDLAIERLELAIKH
jgi:hypothetical protein